MPDMPYKYRSKKKVRKAPPRKYRKKRYVSSRRPFTTNLLRGPSNNRAIARLRYCGSQTLTPASAGLIRNHVFSCNGLFDPDITSTGHQPMGFDELMARYVKYHVVASKITVTFNGITANQYLCGVHTNHAAATYTTDGELQRERKRTLYKIVPGTTGSRSQSTVSLRFNAKNFFGRRTIIDVDDLSGSSSANPVDQAYFYVFAGSADTATDCTGGIRIVFQIEYTAVFTEPIPFDQS